MINKRSREEFRNSDIYMNSNGRIYVNGKEIPCPLENPNSVTVVNDKVYIDGYELKGNKWKRTIRAI